METTRDALLGGRVTVRQPARGFRAGSDAVFLAAACPARPGDTVLDLGCGVGAAMLCVAARVGRVAAVGVERDAATAALAAENAAPWEGEVVEADVLDLPVRLRARSFDHVILNPPYFAAGGGSPSPDPAREAALREEGADGLAAWCDVACRRAGPRGTVTAIVRADRTADVLSALAPRLGGLAIRPVAAAPDAPAGRVIIGGRKDSRAPLRLMPPLVTHDGGRQTPAAEAILRDAAPFA